jgi:hypothetical protein
VINASMFAQLPHSRRKGYSNAVVAVYSPAG